MAGSISSLGFDQLYFPSVYQFSGCYPSQTWGSIQTLSILRWHFLFLSFFFKVKEFVTEELDKFAGSDNQETLFTPAERVYLLEICLESVQYDKVSCVGRFCLYPSALVADAIIIPIVEGMFYATIQFSLVGKMLR